MSTPWEARTLRRPNLAAVHLSPGDARGGAQQEGETDQHQKLRQREESPPDLPRSILAP
ncbi:MAG TPA: hypothetical protein VFX49_12675 [Chloroflexota bacterium]|nr:hypothetical protein [Chloroflexota bacterium]